jgi:hypothetical protein
MVRRHLSELRLNEIDDESTKDSVTQNAEDEEIDTDQKRELRNKKSRKNHFCNQTGSICIGY